MWTADEAGECEPMGYGRTAVTSESGHGVVLNKVRFSLRDIFFYSPLTGRAYPRKRHNLRDANKWTSEPSTQAIAAVTQD